MCGASSKHLAMAALVPLVTRYQDGRCGCRALAGKRRSCEMEYCLMLDSTGVDNEWMVLNQALVMITGMKLQTTGYLCLLASYMLTYM